jgi:dTMP kinase
LQKQGKKVLKTRAPGGTQVGSAIRDVLLHIQGLSSRAELFLFLADRSEHVDKVILPALQSGTLVLCDRFNDSTLAYQGGARGFDEEQVRKLCAFATQDLQPDLTLYLDIDPQLGLSRVRRSKDRIESEQITFHEKIRQVYLKIAKKEPDRFHVLDASKAPEEVYKEACSIIFKVYRS